MWPPKDLHTDTRELYQNVLLLWNFFFLKMIVPQYVTINIKQGLENAYTWNNLKFKKEIVTKIRQVYNMAAI